MDEENDFYETNEENSRKKIYMNEEKLLEHEFSNVNFFFHSIFF